MKTTLKTLWVLLVSVGLIFPNFYGDILSQILHGLRFGAVSYPSSLDSFENPGATQSVATPVSHSTHHANANDALEAIEAKLGTGASLPVLNTFLVGNGAGTSMWSHYATGTNIWLSGLGTFGNLLSTGSSTVVGSLNITGNSTSTNATSTTYAFTSLATSTRYFGAGLTTCNSGNVITWASGFFGCATDATGALAMSNSTSTAPNAGVEISTTTALTIGQKIMIWAGGSPQCNAATVNYDLVIKPPNNASTTIDTKYSDAGNCANNNGIVPVSLQGIWTATSTGSYKIFIQSSIDGAGLWGTSDDGVDTPTSIMFITN